MLCASFPVLFVFTDDFGDPYQILCSIFEGVNSDTFTDEIYIDSFKKYCQAILGESLVISREKWLLRVLKYSGNANTLCSHLICLYIPKHKDTFVLFVPYGHVNLIQIL